MESYAARISDGSGRGERRGVARAGMAPAQADTEDPRVAEVLAGTIGIDMHNHVTPGGARPEQGRKEQQKSQSNLDLADEIKRSGLTAVCAAFRLDFNAREPYARFLQGLTAVDSLLGKDRLTRAMNRKDLQVAHDKGQPALVQSIEGAHFLEGHLERVEEVYKRGLRHLQLLHDKGDKVEPLGDIYTEPPRLGGLTPFGAAVVKECNRLGIVVNLAHASHETVLGAMKVSTQPVIVSHTSLDTRAGKNPRMAKMMAPRLISKDHARVVADAGGVIGVWTKCPTRWASTSRASRRWWMPSASITSASAATPTSCPPGPANPPTPLGPACPADSSRRPSRRCSARVSRPARSARSAAETFAGFSTR